MCKTLSGICSFLLNKIKAASLFVFERKMAKRNFGLSRLLLTSKHEQNVFKKKSARILHCVSVKKLKQQF